LQISVDSQAGLHSGMHCPAWQANPGEQIGTQLVAGASTIGTTVAAPALAGGAPARLRRATVAEMNIPAPSGLIPSLNP
jgi:hypothetical protein